MKQAYLKRSLALWPALFLFCAVNANAQLYKWVGPDGKVTYTDTPPPPSAQRVQARPLAVGEVNAAGLPYELSQAVKAHPVTLYTTKSCAPCEDGRKLLSARGIPFAERTVNSDEDIVQFRKLGDGELPLLTVGSHQQRGFESSTWHTALTSAGYPENSKLPRTYRNPAPEAAAPALKAVAAQPQENQERREQSGASARTPSAAEPPAPVGNAPPGFRF